MPRVAEIRIGRSTSNLEGEVDREADIINSISVIRNKSLELEVLR